MATSRFKARYLLLAIPIAALLGLAWYFRRDAVITQAMQRGEIMRQYAFALEHVAEKRGSLPDTWREFLAVYDAMPDKPNTLPSEADWGTPLYRPFRQTTGGPYLVMAEAPQPGWFAQRYVMYMTSDNRDTHLALLTKEQFERAIKDDDKRRAEADNGRGHTP